MKKSRKWPLLLAAGIAVGIVAAGYAQQQDDQMQKDVASSLADLRKAKAGFDLAQTTVIADQKDLAITEQRIHTFDETQAIRGRIDKDQTTVQSYTSKIVGDINFLQSQWNLLTDDEKTFVNSVRKALN